MQDEIEDDGNGVGKCWPLRITGLPRKLSQTERPEADTMVLYLKLKTIWAV